MGFGSGAFISWDKTTERIHQESEFQSDYPKQYEELQKLRNELQSFKNTIFQDDISCLKMKRKIYSVYPFK